MSAVDVLAVPHALSVAEVAYLNELAAEITANGQPSGDLMIELQAAHDRRRDFGMEMLEGKSRRSQQVRRVLGTAVFVQANLRSTFDTLAIGEADEYRVAWLQSAALARCKGEKA